MQKPQFVRKLEIIFRLANVLFVLHIGITVYNEFMWFNTVTDLTNIITKIQTFPSKFVTLHLTDQIQINERENSQMDMHSRID